MATINEQVLANLQAKLLEISVNPKPSYDIDGQSVSWVEYYRFLSGEVSRMEGIVAAQAPYEIVEEGYT